MHEPTNDDHKLEEGQQNQQRGVDSTQVEGGVDVEQGHFDRSETGQEGSDLPILPDRWMRGMLGIVSGIGH